MSNLVHQREFHPNGQLHWEAFILNDKQHGLSRTWDEKGQLIYEATFEEGKPNGTVRRWHANGQFKSEQTFIRGLEDGTSRFWDEAGNLLHSYTMTRGTGVTTTRGGWMGTSCKISFRNGQFHGPFEVFWPDGKLASRKFHFQGREVSKKKFAELSTLEAQKRALPAYFEDTAAIEWLAKKIAASKPSAKQIEQSRETEAGCLKELARDDAAEARAWLDSAALQQTRIIGNCQTTEESRAMVDVIYADGAEIVTVMNIHTEPDRATTSQFVITLPNASAENRAKRAKLLARCSLWSTEQGFDPIADAGQLHEFVWFD
ncbi:MAG: toxin-antitoxin system YwqK family antitoxin [Phycisphaeraceae bacterium]|nr:toxin-antitoxin system YwqK family antitoxin [Phycisphaeraceae bacterium]